MRRRRCVNECAMTGRTSLGRSDDKDAVMEVQMGEERSDWLCKLALLVACDGHGFSLLKR